MDKVAHTEADRAVWLIYCAYYTAEMMDSIVKDVVRLFDRYNIAEWLLSGYRSFHTQGFEYMAELISDRIHEEQVIPQ